jgi:hypothetical protein
MKDSVDRLGCFEACRQLQTLPTMSTLAVVAINLVEDRRYEEALTYLLGAYDMLQATGEFATDRLMAIKVCRQTMKALIPGRTRP